ncbi:MAG TPA: vanadium-dependent haloperoxidase [Catalimonadaceae bacterium]|nr:vanadium-dependent haloperoxidase [Catalimonadaceae bacterium]
MIRICPFILLFFLSISRAEANSENYLVRCNLKLVEVIMEDLFTPVVAGRVKVYPNIAAYEVLSKKGNKLRTLQPYLNQMKPISGPTQAVDFSLASLFAFTTVAKKLVYSEYMFVDFERHESSIWLKAHKNDSVLLNNSISYGRLVSAEIIKWMKGDNYDYTRTLSRYVLADSAGAWIPTGPGYANALEPNWPLMRSFVFDSLNRVKAIPNLKYSEDKNSRYYKNALALYNQSLNLDTAKKLTAWFWDNNPNILKSDGHVNYFIHKVSPSGHWIRIASQAIKNRGLDEYKTTELYTLLSLAIYEGFLSCWTEKFQSNALRPETYINRLIAPQWKSYIETPPFPEYTSGHSVVSSASATILSALIKQPYAFTDSSEMYINLPPRHFKSFREASNQASISRFYGGIHFMPSLDNGVIQGEEIGNFILRKLKSKKD